MKTLYLTKYILPFIFLPVAPGVLQLELARQGYLTGTAAAYVIAAQGIFTLVTLGWLGITIIRQRQGAFLRMSCVSKKVYIQGRWMAVEQYLAENHNIQVSHAMTPEETQAWIAEAQEYLRRENVAAEADQSDALPEPIDSESPRHFQESAA
jgi:hypothetical protein